MLRHSAFLCKGVGFIEKITEKIKCPYCGYKMPLFKSENASCRGIWVKCKNPKCKHKFEIKIECQGE